MAAFLEATSSDEDADAVPGNEAGEDRNTAVACARMRKLGLRSARLMDSELSAQESFDQGFGESALEMGKVGVLYGFTTTIMESLKRRNSQPPKVAAARELCEQILAQLETCRLGQPSDAQALIPTEQLQRLFSLLNLPSSLLEQRLVFSDK